MSLGYFDDPKKKSIWENEINQMRQEKARRTNGMPKKEAEISFSEKRDRVPITYAELFRREYGEPKPQQLSRSTARQLEKTKEMGGKNR